MTTRRRHPAWKPVSRSRNEERTWREVEKPEVARGKLGKRALLARIRNDYIAWDASYLDILNGEPPFLWPAEVEDDRVPHVTRMLLTLAVRAAVNQAIAELRLGRRGVRAGSVYETVRLATNMFKDVLKPRFDRLTHTRDQAIRRAMAFDFAVLYLERLVEIPDSWLVRVRRCRAMGCERPYFWTRHTDPARQVFCSDPCRVAHARSHPIKRRARRILKTR